MSSQKRVVSLAAIGAFVLLVGTSGCSGGGSSGSSSRALIPPTTPGGSSFTIAGSTAKISEFPIASGDSGPAAITVAPDGNAWFLSQLGVDRIAIAGTVKTFHVESLSGYNNQTDITVGPDSAVWFTAACNLATACASGPTSSEPGQQLARITNGGAITLVANVASNDHGVLPTRLISGPGHNIWVTGERAGPLSETGGQYLSISPNGTTVLQKDLPLACPALDAFERYFGVGITEGADGAVYIVGAQGDFEQCPFNQVFRVNSSGTITNTFFLSAVTAGSSGSVSIASGPDGNLWIAQGGETNSIARMTPAGVVTEFPIPTPNAGLARIAAGNDGAIWFTEFNASKIGRITTSGVITEYPTPTAKAGPYGIASLQGECGSGHGRIWFTEENTNQIGRIDF